MMLKFVTDRQAKKFLHAFSSLLVCWRRRCHFLEPNYILSL